MVRRWRVVWAFLGMVMAAVLFSPLVARASAVDPDLTDAVDTMTGSLKVNGIYVAKAVILVALIIWLFFWAFGKIKKTAGR